MLNAHGNPHWISISGYIEADPTRTKSIPLLLAVIITSNSHTELQRETIIILKSMAIRHHVAMSNMR